MCLCGWVGLCVCVCVHVLAKIGLDKPLGFWEEHRGLKEYVLLNPPDAGKVLGNKVLGENRATSVCATSDFW